MFSPNFFPQQAITSDRFRDLTPVAEYESSEASETWSEDYTDYESDEETTETAQPEKTASGLSRKKRAAAALTEIRQNMLTTASVAPRQASWDEAQSGRKRCIRCHRYYTEKEYFTSPTTLPAPPSPPRLIDHDEDVPVVPYTPTDPSPSSSSSSSSSTSTSTSTASQQLQQGCFYHPGRFTETALTNGLRGGWSCCRDTSGSNARAYVKSSQGCRFSPFHREDMLYTNTILKFGFSPDAQAEYDRKMAEQEAEQQAKQAQAVATATQALTPMTCKENPDLFHVHVVTGLDTLEGLALRYGVPSSEIRRLNRFQTIPEMQIIGKLFIPKKVGETPLPPPRQPRPDGSVSAFQMATRASVAEAKYYLAETEGNVEEAIRLWRTDLAWERQQS